MKNSSSTSFPSLKKTMSTKSKTPVTLTTPWFEPAVKPKRIGVYEVQWPSPKSINYCYWNGPAKGWGWLAPTPEQCKLPNFKEATNAFQFKPWRGLDRPAA